VDSLPDPADPLLSVASAVLVDSRDADGPAELRALLQLARSRTVVDLSWNRLRPWRELLAALFDPPRARPYLECVEAARVAGKPGPRRLLGGWLAAQTGLAPRRISLVDERHASLELTALRSGDRASFTVSRVEGRRLVAAEAALPGADPVRASALLPDHALAGSLAGALTRLGPDPVWERAVSAASALGG
jgi:glucose-6-phosphate dehydrogenase assembly protein OpcA